MIEEARRVVSQLWPRLSYDEDTQTHPVVVPDGSTIGQLIKVVEERVRDCQTRCARHQTLLQCICPTCQSKSCVECNESVVQVKCSRCQTCITSSTHARTQGKRKKPVGIQLLNVHALGTTGSRKSQGRGSRKRVTQLQRGLTIPSTSPGVGNRNKTSAMQSSVGH